MFFGGFSVLTHRSFKETWESDWIASPGINVVIISGILCTVSYAP